MRRDKDVYRLQLHRLERLPKDVLVELLQDACRQLDLSEPSLLLGAIAKVRRRLLTRPFCFVCWLDSCLFSSPPVQKGTNPLCGVAPSC